MIRCLHADISKKEKKLWDFLIGWGEANEDVPDFVENDSINP